MRKIMASGVAFLEYCKFYISLINNKMYACLSFVYIDFLDIKNRLLILAVDFYLIRQWLIIDKYDSFEGKQLHCCLA